MTRRIISSQRQAAVLTPQGTAGAPGGAAAPATTAIDGFTDRIVKYVPADVVAAWTAAVALIPGLDGARTVFIVAILIGVLVTAAWTWRATKKPQLPPSKVQIAVSCVAFVVWAITVSSSDMQVLWPEFSPNAAKLILILFTAVSGLIPTED